MEAGVPGAPGASAHAAVAGECSTPLVSATNRSLATAASTVRGSACNTVPATFRTAPMATVRLVSFILKKISVHLSSHTCLKGTAGMAYKT